MGKVGGRWEGLAGITKRNPLSYPPGIGPPERIVGPVAATGRFVRRSDATRGCGAGRQNAGTLCVHTSNRI